MNDQPDGEKPVSGEPIVDAQWIPEVDLPFRVGRHQGYSATDDASDNQPPVTWRELAAVLLMVVLADLAIYRGHGFAGYALFFLLAPVLLFLGSPRRNRSRWLLATGLMLVVIAARLAWCGMWLQVGCGIALVAAFSMTLAGLRPFVLELIIYASQTILSGYGGLDTYRRTADRLAPLRGPSSWLNVVLPTIAFVVFGLIFIVANPDLLTSFNQSLDWLANSLREWMRRFAPDWQEVAFWAAIAWLTIGLLRPAAGSMIRRISRRLEMPRVDDSPRDAPLYVAFRNTLLTVIALFAVYLVFEFRTLWFREFPPGFYYAGYAHEGAAWLTVALALATVVLSLIFRGPLLGDPRLPRLRRMAWAWSLENLLLAAAVYHRMLIYVQFNGMTWMRTVGFFGMTCVVVGFGLVVWKIARNHSFAWLLRHHLLVLALFVYLFALTPVDALVHAYNVRRILSGDSAPSVQISVHPISTEGYLVLFPLTDCRDEKIREGVLAMLADRHDQVRRQARDDQEAGWTAYQASERALLDALDKRQAQWSRYANLEKRRQALAAFRTYAYRWY
ncbi:MAG: DUF4153 domain-containing protein [Thermoguttaceae bacterium]